MIAIKGLIVPWKAFRDTLRNQSSGQLETWLGCWLFADEGVITVGGKIERPRFFPVLLAER